MPVNGDPSWTAFVKSRKKRVSLPKTSVNTCQGAVVRFSKMNIRLAVDNRCGSLEGLLASKWPKPCRIRFWTPAELVHPPVIKHMLCVDGVWSVFLGVRASRKQNRQERRLMKGFQIQPSIPEFEMSPSSSLPNLLEDTNDSPGEFSSPNSKRSPANRMKISKFKFNVPRGPTQASKQWDLLLRAAKKKKENISPIALNHTESVKEPKQTVIEVKIPLSVSADAAGPLSPPLIQSAPLAVIETALKGDPIKGFHRPHFRWRDSPSSSTEENTSSSSATLPHAANSSTVPGAVDSVASLIYHTRELSPLFTHPLVNEVTQRPSPFPGPPLNTTPVDPAKRRDLPQPYLSSITMLWLMRWPLSNWAFGSLRLVPKLP